MERDALIFLTGLLAGLGISWLCRFAVMLSHQHHTKSVMERIRIQLPQPDDDGEAWKRGGDDGAED